MGVTRVSADGEAAAAVAAFAVTPAAAFALASATKSALHGKQVKRSELTLQGTSINGELNSLGRRSSSEVVNTSLESPLPTIEVH